jgi:minor extracellular serine protease Vpr
MQRFFSTFIAFALASAPLIPVTQALAQTGPAKAGVGQATASGLLRFSAAGRSRLNRIDPMLHLAYPEFTVGAALELSPNVTNRPTFKSLVALPGPDNIADVPVLIHSDDIATTTAFLAAQGVASHVTRLTDNVLSAHVAPEALALLSARGEVGYVEWAKPRALSLGKSVPDTRADLLHIGQDLDAPVTGEGVIVGVLDSGIDYTNDVFKHDDGSTRLLAYWDQDNTSGPPPKGYNYGRECTSAMINDGSCANITTTRLDFIGHGTHVTSTAAGRGSPADGMATKADIILVKSGSFQNIEAAAKYIFAKADELKRPCVINMSLGGHLGPHDGTSISDDVLSKLGGPGKVIVVAAGNEGSNAIHLGYELQPDYLKTNLRLEVASQGSDGSNYIDMWLEDGAKMTLQIALEQNGEEVAATPETDVSTAGVFLNQTTLDIGGSVSFSTSRNPFNKKINLFIAIKNALSDSDSTRRFVLKLKGQGRFDAWMVSQSFFGGGSAAFGTKPGEGIATGDSSKTIGSPGTSPRVVTVAAHVTRTSWVIGGRRYTRDGTVGDIAGFSSRGPSANSEITGLKPEISAPGEYIQAAAAPGFSQFSFGAYDSKSKTVYQAGTSMACPHVAGAVALLMQIDPTLDPERVKAILAATARKDEFTVDLDKDIEGEGKYRWGAGKLDAYAAALAVLGKGVCNDDLPCAKGASCVAGQCTANAVGGACASDNDCPNGSLCTEQKCVAEGATGDTDGGETDGLTIDEDTTGGAGDDDGGDEGGGCSAAARGRAPNADSAMLLLGAFGLVLFFSARRRRNR